MEKALLKEKQSFKRIRIKRGASCVGETIKHVVCNNMKWGILSNICLQST